MSFNIKEADLTFSQTLYPVQSNSATFWNPRPYQLYEIMDYLYNNTHNIFQAISTNLMNADPQKAILSLRVYPIDFKELFNTQNYPRDFKLYGKAVPTTAYLVNTLPVRAIASRNIPIGTIDVPYVEGVDSYLSYDPFSKYYLYLPFASLMELNAKRVVGKRLIVTAILNMYEGTITYNVEVSEQEDDAPRTFLEQVSTKICIDIPLYSSNTNQVLKDMFLGLINGAFNVAGGIANQNAGATFKSIGTTLTNTLGVEFGSSTLLHANADILGKMLNPYKLTLIRYTPKVKYHLDDTNYNHLYGVPCKKIDRLNTFGGFTKVGGIHIKEIPNATTEEVAEIESLLKQGVILDNTNAIFNITYNYNSSQVTLSNPQTSIMFGGTYATSVNAVSGYLIDDIKVYMGAQDITSTAVTGNVINVTNVIANISIRITSSSIPQTFDVIYNQLVGVTLSNPAVTIEEGETYETNLIPQYSLGYILSAFNYSPIVLQGHVYLPSAYANGTVRVTNVSDDIEIRGTFPQVTDMTNQWLYNGDFMSLPTEPIDLSNKVVNFDDGNTQYTGNDIIIDNQENIDGTFISFTTATSDSVTIDRSGNIYVNDVLTSHLVNIDFYMPSEYYTSYTGLLPWLDNNFHINFTP